MIERNQFSNLFLAPENSLELTSTTYKDGNSRDERAEFYNEVSPNGEVIATYRIWVSSSNYPPFKTTSGWEKFDLNGKNIGSGYS